MGWLSALVSIARPVLGRVLVALGMSVITISGVDVAINTMVDQIIGTLGSGPVAALQLAGLSGCWTALGLMFGGVTFALSYWSLTQATQILGKAA